MVVGGILPEDLIDARWVGRAAPSGLDFGTLPFPVSELFKRTQRIVDQKEWTVGDTDNSK